METNIKKFIDDSANNNIYEIKTEDNSISKEIGWSEEIVRRISAEKNEPDWVLDIRLKALRLYDELNNPDWDLI